MIIRTLLGQSHSELENLSKMFGISLANILLIGVWLQSASILSKAFTGLLLNTYFNVMWVPIVNDLQDIIDNKDINIAGEENLLKWFLVNYQYDQHAINGFLARVDRYQEQVNYRERFHLDYMIYDPLLNDIINGKTVLTNSILN